MILINKRPIIQYLVPSIVAMSLFLSSCATKKDTEFLEVESRQVEKSLGIDDKKFDKFQIKNESAGEKEIRKKVSDNLSKERPISIQKIETKTKIKETLKTEIAKDDVKSVMSLDSDKMEEGQFKQDESIDPYPPEFKKYDEVSKKVWPKSEPIVEIGEKFVFKVSYLGITAGHIQMETKAPVKIGGQSAYHFTAKLRSARYYSYIYTLDDSLDSYVTRDSFIPMKYVLSQRESSQTVDDLQLFDQEELKTYHWYKRVKHGKLKEVELTKHIPFYFQDSFSALHFVRSLPLVKGDRYEYPIVTRGKIWILKIKVEETEEIEIMDRDVSAIRISAETHFPGVLEKKGDILFWFSADNKKKLLKFEAQVKIGAAAGELVEYKAGKPLK